MDEIDGHEKVKYFHFYNPSTGETEYIKKPVQYKKWATRCQDCENVFNKEKISKKQG